MVWGEFRKTCVRFLLIVVAFGASACMSDFAEWELRDVMDPEIDEIVSEAGRSYQIVGMGVGIVHRGAIVYLRGYGWADREKRKEVDPFSTLFRWASISKTITGMMVGVALEQGWIDSVDRDVRAYFPDFPHEGITLRHLVSHQSGIVHYESPNAKPIPPRSLLNDPNHNTGIAWALPYWWDTPLLFEPGTQMEYSSPAFNMAGAVIERASGTGKSFAELVEEYVSIPAGLDDLRPDYGWKEIPGRAKGYVLQRMYGRPEKEDTSEDISWKLPSGGFLSSVRDMTRYCKALMREDIVSIETRDMLMTRNVLKNGKKIVYGMAWIVGHKEKRRRIRHSGQQAGATSTLILYPDEDLCYVVMTNTWDKDWRDGQIQLRKLVQRLDDLIVRREAAGEPVIQPVAGSTAALLQESPIRR